MPGTNLLERNIRKILELSGFEPELRVKQDSYEIDVFMQYQGLYIAFECKQYEKSNLTVRNLIHQWKGKQEEIGLDKVVLVIVGSNIAESDYELAEKKDITIWDGDKVDKLMEEAIERKADFQNNILSEIGLTDLPDLDEKIEDIRGSHNVSGRFAKKYALGEIGKNELENLSELNDLIVENDFLEKSLSSDDKRRYRQNKDYYGTSFQKVVELMSRFQIKDKKKAQVLVNNQGGKAGGVKYSKTRLKKMRELMEVLGQTFDEAETSLNLLEEEDSLTLKRVRRIVNVKSERTDLDLELINRALENGYTVRELKKAEDVELHSQESSEGLLAKFISFLR